MATAAEEEPQLSEGILEFVIDLFEYIWTQHKLYNSTLDKQFAEKLSLKLLKPEETKKSPYTEDIGKAVLTTQYLFREMCSDLFKIFKNYISRCRKSFIFCSSLTHHICCEFRSDVFLKFIDISAIIAEAFLFCDAQAKPVLDIYEAADMLVGFFEIHIAKKFFEYGGWQQLQATSKLYRHTYLVLENYINLRNIPYVPIHYDCDLIGVLRESLVPFPVHISWFCGNCRRESDKEYRISYNSDLTVEDFIRQHTSVTPPWKMDGSEVIPSQDEPVAGPSSRSSAERQMIYVFVAKGREVAEKLDEQKKNKASKKHKHKMSPMATSSESKS